MASKSPSAAQAVSFEDAMAELEQLVARMEAGELPLLYPAIFGAGYFQPARRRARVKRNSARRSIFFPWMLMADWMRRS